MSSLWRASSLTLAVAFVLLVSGQYLDSQTAAGAGANIGAGFLVLLGWGVGAVGLMVLVGAIVGDRSRARSPRDRSDEQ